MMREWKVIAAKMQPIAAKSLLQLTYAANKRMLKNAILFQLCLNFYFGLA